MNQPITLITTCLAPPTSTNCYQSCKVQQIFHEMPAPLQPGTPLHLWNTLPNHEIVEGTVSRPIAHSANHIILEINVTSPVESICELKVHKKLYKFKTQDKLHRFWLYRNNKILLVQPPAVIPSPRLGIGRLFWVKS